MLNVENSQSFNIQHSTFNIQVLEEYSEPDWEGIYLDFLSWGLITLESDRTMFWLQPDWKILKIWSEVKKRKLEEVNDYSRATALLTSQVHAFMRSFGGGTAGDLPTANDFLPFQFEDPNSGKAQLKRQIRPSILELTRKLIAESKIPPKVIRSLYDVPGMLELLEEN